MRINTKEQKNIQCCTLNLNSKLVDADIEFMNVIFPFNKRWNERDKDISVVVDLENDFARSLSDLTKTQPIVVFLYE